MNKKTETKPWQAAMLCLLIWMMLSESAGAQTPWPMSKQHPGLPKGYTIIEGDIQMPISVVNAMRQQRKPGEPAAPEANWGGRLWTNQIVLYQFQTAGAPTSTCTNAPNSGAVSPANQQIMRNAMNVIEGAPATPTTPAIPRVANVRFLQCANNNCSGVKNYLIIRDTTNDTTANPVDNSCVNAAKNNSIIGMASSGPQAFNIQSWGSPFIIIHELLHALGMYHEQARADRDTYVDVTSLCANIQGGCMNNSIFNNDFNRKKGINYGPYDFDSVMQYGQCAFSRNPSCPTPSMAFPDGGVTIKVKPPYDTQLSPGGVTWPNAIGQVTHLSELDKLIVSFLYPEPNWRFVGNALPVPTNFLVQTGGFTTPYEKLATAIDATPEGGTIWLQPGTYTLLGELSKKLTLRGPLGDVTIKQGTPGAFGSTLTSVSAASYGGELAADSIVAAFGANLATSTASANSLPLPTTLAGVTVKVTDSEQTTRDAPLFFVSPSQINYLVPAGSKAGLAKIIVYNGDRVVANSESPINPVAPALFTANASGQGVPAAVALRVRANGSQSLEPVAQFDAAQQRFVPVPIDLGPEGEQVFLILFGTGFRAPAEPGAVATFIGDEIAEVLFAGAAPGFAGLDQANVRAPRSLAGKGEVSILLIADDRASNAVTVNFR
jgi:uncharacterized protein (TIGR03437 family)